MLKLADHQIQEIIRCLRAGEDLPPEYRYLLFPDYENSYEVIHHQLELVDDDGDLPPAHILVVDDNEFNRDLLTDQLEFRGYQVTTAENGQIALEKLTYEPFDLVLLDIMMPVMDGYQVLEHLREDPDLRHMPVIVISAVDDKSSVIRCIEMGAEDYLFKPFDSTLLRARINASLEKKRLRDKELRALQALEIEHGEQPRQKRHDKG